MYIGLMTCLFVGTFVIAVRLREALLDHDAQGVRVQAIVGIPLLLVTAAAAWALFTYPQLAVLVPPSPLGPEWECTGYGRGAHYCEKVGTVRAGTISRGEH